MLSWQDIDSLIWQAQAPLPDPWLEKLNNSVPPAQPYYRFLYLLAEKLHPPLALEIGVYQGVASAHLAAALADWDGQVIGLDINPVGVAKELTDRYGNYWFMQADACSDEAVAYVDRLIDRYGKLGIVFQDSSHHYLPTVKEWEIYAPRCVFGGVWLADDITPAFWNADSDPPGKGMVQYWESLPVLEKRLYPQTLHIGNAMGIALLGQPT